MSAFHIALPLVAALFVAALSTPLVGRLALTLGVVDRPNERKINRRHDMPLMGGVAVALGTCAGLVVVALQFGSDVIAYEKLRGFVLGGAIVLALGVWDDRFGMRAWTKFAVQILAASVAYAWGFAVESFRVPLGGATIDLYHWVSVIVTLFWIVAVTNAINLVDGLDGLAAGLSGIIAVTLTYICLQSGQATGLVIGAALIGAILGFLPHNFPPARIFLGDTGALYLGFSLSLLAIDCYTGGYRRASVLAFVVPLLALAVPLIDTLLSIVRRVRGGRGIFDADRMHMHHMLLSTEGSQSRAVLFLYLLTGCFCVIAVSFTRLEDAAIGLALLAAVAVLTIRLLRNLGSLSVEEEESPGTGQPNDPPLAGDGGVQALDGKATGLDPAHRRGD